MSDSVRPHRWQPTRLRRPWDSPGKNTGVGCHFLLQCMKVKSESEVAQSCPTHCYPMECSLPGFSDHGIFQVRILKWIAISFPGDLPDQGTEPRSPELQADTLTSEPPGKPASTSTHILTPTPTRQRRQWHPTLQYSCLGNPMDGGAWKAAVHRVAAGQT